MRKRVLSVLLALALCFTCVAGFAHYGEGAAPNGRIDRNVDRLDNILTNYATPEQQAAISEVVAAAPKVDITKAPWDGIADKILNPMVLEESITEITDKTVLPYFFMRWLEGQKVDAEKYPLVADLQAKFAASNEKYRVDNVDFGTAADEFDPYSDEISAELLAFAENPEGQRQLLLYTGHIKEGDSYVEKDYDDEILNDGLEQAKVELEIILQKLVDVVLSEASENYTFQASEGNILHAFREILKDDETLKNSAILVGMDFINLALGGGIMNAVKDFVREQDITNPDTPIGSLLVDAKTTVFSNETKTSIDGSHEIAHKLADEVVNSAADSAKLTEAIDGLKARGLEVADLIDMEEAVKGAIDPEDVLEVIWLNLGLGRVLQVESTPGAVKSSTDPTVDQEINLSIGHRFIDQFVKNPTYMEKINGWAPAWFYIEINDPDAVVDGNDTTLEKYGLTLMQGNGAHHLIYDASKVYEANDGKNVTIPVTIYRGVKPLEADPDGQPVVERYVMETTVELTAAKTEAPVTNKEITLTAPKGEKYDYMSGDTVTIKGTSKNFELISIYIQAPGAQRYLYTVVSAAEFAQGITFKLGVPAVVGEYTVYAGDNDKQATATFEVTKPEQAPVQVVQEGNEPALVKVRKTKAKTWEDFLKAAGTSVPEVVELKDADGKVHGTAPITWLYNEGDLSDADKAAGYAAFDPKTTKQQLIKGVYSVNEITWNDKDEAHDVVKNADGYPYPIDEIVPLKVKLTTSGGGGGTSYYANFIDDAMGFDGNTNIVKVKGETNLSRVVIDTVGPDGKVITSGEYMASNFTTGFDLDLSAFAPLGIGTYTLVLKGTDGTKYDEYEFKVDPVTFMVTDHISYIQGYPDGGVHPQANITREEVATILFRLLNDNYRNGWMTKSTNRFSDMTADNWSMTAVATMTTAGVINGYPDGTFGPQKAITRAEFAAMTARMCASRISVSENPYSDINDTWAKDDILLVTAMGWFQGDTNGQFRPEDNLTRAEAITVINRMLGRDKVDASSFANMTVASFNDLNENDWYYTAIIEATTAHNHEMSNGKEVWTGTKNGTDWSIYE